MDTTLVFVSAMCRLRPTEWLGNPEGIRSDYKSDEPRTNCGLACGRAVSKMCLTMPMPLEKSAFGMIITQNICLVTLRVLVQLDQCSTVSLFCLTT